MGEGGVEFVFVALNPTLADIFVSNRLLISSKKHLVAFPCAGLEEHQRYAAGGGMREP